MEEKRDWVKLFKGVAYETLKYTGIAVSVCVGVLMAGYISCSGTQETPLT
jgi:hypothetical protein